MLLLRKIVGWSLLALFGTMSLVGQGLHVFHGGHHSFGDTCCGTCPPALGEHRHDHAHLAHHHAGHAHRHGPEEAAAGPAVSAVAVDDHQCPICQTLAQGQYAAPPAAAQFERIVEPAASPIAFSWQAPALSPYHGRAPPLV